MHTALHSAGLVAAAMPHLFGAAQMYQSPEPWRDSCLVLHGEHTAAPRNILTVAPSLCPSPVAQLQTAALPPGCSPGGAEHKWFPSAPGVTHALGGTPGGGWVTAAALLTRRDGVLRVCHQMRHAISVSQQDRMASTGNAETPGDPLHSLSTLPGPQPALPQSKEAASPPVRPA